MNMKNNFTLSYWIDEGWYVGKIREIPGVFSQGKTLEELIENIKDAYSLMMEENLEDIAEKSNNVEIELTV